MGGPKEVYFVSVIRGTGKGLRYGQRGGGLFTNLSAAQDRRKTVGNAGVETLLFKGTVDWEEIE